MDFKAVDLQLAISRTNDTANLQNQLLNKPVVQQTDLAANQIKQIEEMGSKSEKIDKKAENRIKGESERQSSQRERQSKQDQANENENQAPEHPYKGRHIDVSL